MALSPTTILRNGQVYSWSGTRINIAGVDIVGITAISYSESETIEPIYAQGNRPVGMGRGPVEYSASITLLADEVQRLQQASPTGRLQDLPAFDLPVVFQAGLKIMTDRLQYVKFKTNNRELAQGDTSISVELELFIGGIIWGK